MGTLDELGQGVCGIDGIFAGNDSDRFKVVGPLVDSLGDDGSDELEDVRADRASNYVGSCDLFNELIFVRPGVDGPIIGDDRFGCAVSADLNDLV